jgi:hypothetical protein
LDGAADPGALGIPRRTYYRWLKEEAWARTLPEGPVRPVQPYEALPEEKQAVVAYALKHPELRHRELAWRMVDEDVACLSPSTVYTAVLVGFAGRRIVS